VVVKLPAWAVVVALVLEWCSSVDIGRLLGHASQEVGIELILVYSPADLKGVAGNWVRVTLIGVVNCPEEQEVAEEVTVELEQVLGVLDDQSHCHCHCCYPPLDPVPAR